MDGVTPRDYKFGYHEIVGYLIKTGAVRPEPISRSELLEECSYNEEPSWSELLGILVHANDAPVDIAAAGDPDEENVWLIDWDTAEDYYDALWEVPYKEIGTLKGEPILPDDRWPPEDDQ